MRFDPYYVKLTPDEKRYGQNIKSPYTKAECQCKTCNPQSYQQSQSNTVTLSTEQLNQLLAKLESLETQVNQLSKLNVAVYRLLEKGLIQNGSL